MFKGFLTAFLWVIVIWHGIGLLGSIESLRSRPADGWQWFGAIAGTLILASAICLLILRP